LAELEQVFTLQQIYQLRLVAQLEAAGGLRVDAAGGDGRSGLGGGERGGKLEALAEGTCGREAVVVRDGRPIQRELIDLLQGEHLLELGQRSDRLPDERIARGEHGR